ncbi:hypothetical protein JV59_32175 [Vibrio coralliilyticus]|uniref:tetratricopeptide repeat protein n=1 Tax=Vibrio coralliilyticus TaxID=190893 RepID=UPI0005126DA5|nr:tetratricopeptide repeat protein [Vibrio coralliilyticus]AIU66983.1 hypothetical protein JV59_32175 [Vibrio coralliilyticus]
MKEVNEKDIVKWIQRRRYSNLIFLRNQRHRLDYKWYLGFYYFTLFQKGADTEAILYEVISRYGDESSAYLYLAQTARKIYYSFDDEHISIGYCRKAIKLSPENSEAHWTLYTLSDDAHSYVKAIELEYSSGNYEQVSTWINGFYIHYNHFSQLSNKEWLSLKSILQDSKIKTSNKLLLWAFHNLNEIDSCLSLIYEAERVDLEIIKAYYGQGLINKKFALEKLYFSQIEKFLEGDDEAIYAEYVKEAQKGELNPTYAALMKKAFKVKAFGDIVNYFNSAKDSDPFFTHDKASRIYYLLAQIELCQPLDEEVHNYVQNHSDSLDDESKLLYQILQFQIYLKKVKETDSYNFPLEALASYQNALKIISKQEIVRHFLFDQLKDEAHQVRVEWYKKHNKKQLDNLKTKLSDAEMTEEDFRDLHHYGIECHEYDYVIQSVSEYHKHTPPSISSYNCLGVCYQRQGDLENAFKYYELALRLMHSLQDYSYVIISNYLDCAKRLPRVDISKKEQRDLRKLFNIELTNQFKWGTFTAKNFSCLYKYTSFSVNTIDSLLNQYFYLAKKEQLNDPIELPEIEGIGDDKLIDPNYRLCSLSKNDNSMLMWSHYAQEHQGIMIEYWFGGEFPNGVGVEKVSYTDGLKRSKEKTYHAFNQYLLIKNSDWSYEEEVRIFSNQVEKVNFELFDYPHYDRSKINAYIRSITLGYKFPEDKKNLILNLVSMMNSQRRSHEPLVTLREAIISEKNKFELSYRDLENM